MLEAKQTESKERVGYEGVYVCVKTWGQYNGFFVCIFECYR